MNKQNKTKRKKFKQAVKQQEQKATIFFFSPPLLFSFSSFLLLTNGLFFILFPPVFSLSPCFGIISAFLALAYFQVLLFHLLGTVQPRLLMTLLSHICLVFQLSDSQCPLHFLFHRPPLPHFPPHTKSPVNVPTPWWMGRRR